MTQPEPFMIAKTLSVAAQSPCRSKRGVSLFNCRTGAFRGSGFNGPPRGAPCPDRDVCAGACGQRCVHAEMRALRDAAVWARYHQMDDIELIHIELTDDGGVKPCSGPSCWQCAREVLDVEFVQGVWLYEEPQPTHVESLESFGRWLSGEGQLKPSGSPAWRRYSAEEFYSATLRNCGMKP